MTAELSDIVAGSRRLHVVVGGSGAPSIVFLHGMGERQASQLALEALERVALTAAAHRKIAGYSKGMRQRIGLARPEVAGADLFTATNTPDAFLHEEPAYATWTPQVHRAPATP